MGRFNYNKQKQEQQPGPLPFVEGMMDGGGTMTQSNTTAISGEDETRVGSDLPFARLVRVVQDLSRTRSIDAITAIVRQAARALVGSDGATFVLRDGDRCHYVDEDAIAPLWKGQKFPMAACISGWVMIHRQPAAIADIYADARIPQDAYRPTFVKSLVMVPIRSVEPIGAIGNYWARPHRTSEEELRILQALADSTSVALENAQIYEQLVRSEHRYRDLVENLEDVVLSLDAEGNIQYVSPAVAKFGYTADEMVGRQFECFVHQDDRKSMLSSFTEALMGEAVGCEFRAIGKSGTPFFVRTTMRATLENGIPVGLRGVLIDVTEQRRTEEQLRVSQRLESVGRLAGGVAHDFNNLLTVINSYAGFTLESVKHDKQLHADVQEIRLAGERAAALTRQLLAFSRKQVMQPKVADLNRIISGIEKMLRRLIGEDITLVTLLADDLYPVLIDAGQLEQVIMNLAVNARDAMPTGGRLSIETSNVELDDSCVDQHPAVVPGSYAMIAMSDTGCGMDQQTKEHIFEPFFTTKEAGKGTGLGLATVYGIVRQSHGYIWVYSEPGLGTTFKIYLPRSEGQTAKAGPPARKVVQAAAEATILVVEDVEAVRNIVVRILKAAGYTALAAAGGEEALALCAGHPGAIDLIITDVVMPRMSGREMAERIIRQRPQTVVLYMSGYTDNTIVHHGVLDPGTQFIAKPFSAADLTHKVREVLDGRPGEP